MHDSGVAIVLIIMALVGIGMLVSNFRRARENYVKIRLLAAHLHGNAFFRDGIRPPSIGFKVEGYKALFEFGEPGHEMAKVTVWLPTYRGGRLMVVPKHGFFVGSDIEIGDARFDRDFIIQARPEAVAHRVFDPAQRDAAVDALRRAASRPSFMLRAENGRLEVLYRESVWDAPSLLALVRAASDLIPLLLSTPHSGIEFGETAEEMDGRCPICTTALSEPLIRCRRCSAPHHRECWDYLGRCAVYACEPQSERVA